MTNLANQAARRRDTAVIRILRSAALITLIALGAIAHGQPASRTQIHGQTLIVPPFPGLSYHEPSDLMARIPIAVPPQNILLGGFLGPDLRGQRYLMLQAVGRPVSSTSAEVEKLARSLVNRSNADVVQRLRQPLNEVSRRIAQEQDDPSLVVEVAGMDVTDVVRSTADTSMVRGVLHVRARSNTGQAALTRPFLMTIVRLPPNVLMFAYHYGRFADEPLTTQYDSAMSRWVEQLAASNGIR